MELNITNDLEFKKKHQFKNSYGFFKGDYLNHVPSVILTNESFLKMRRELDLFLTSAVYPQSYNSSEFKKLMKKYCDTDIKDFLKTTDIQNKANLNKFGAFFFTKTNDILPIVGLFQSAVLFVLPQGYTLNALSRSIYRSLSLINHEGSMQNRVKAAKSILIDTFAEPGIRADEGFHGDDILKATYQGVVDFCSANINSFETIFMNVFLDDNMPKIKAILKEVVPSDSVCIDEAIENLPHGKQNSRMTLFECLKNKDESALQEQIREAYDLNKISPGIEKKILDSLKTYQY